MRCLHNPISLPERMFRPAIRDNYQSVRSRLFQLRLGTRQAKDLIRIFEEAEQWGRKENVAQGVAAEERRGIDVLQDNVQVAIPLPLGVVVGADPTVVAPSANVSEERLVRVMDGVEGGVAGVDGGGEEGARPWAVVLGSEIAREVPWGRCFGTTAKGDNEVEGVETAVSLEQDVTRLQVEKEEEAEETEEAEEEVVEEGPTNVQLQGHTVLESGKEEEHLAENLLRLQVWI